VDDSSEIYENMAKALAILTAWNESGDGELSLVEQTTVGYLDSQVVTEAKVREAIKSHFRVGVARWADAPPAGSESGP
jgi:hypothetical protein